MPRKKQQSEELLKVVKVGWDWAAVPREVITDMELKPVDVRVYAYLLLLANKSGQAWPKVPTVASALGLKKTAIIGSFKSLQAANWIRRKRRFAQTAITFIFDSKQKCIDFDGLAINRSGGQTQPAINRSGGHLLTAETVNMNDMYLTTCEKPSRIINNTTNIKQQNGGGGVDLLLQVLVDDLGLFPNVAQIILATYDRDRIMLWLHHSFEQGKNPAALFAKMIKSSNAPPSPPKPGTDLHNERMAREVAWGLREPERTPAAVTVEPDDAGPQEAQCTDEINPGVLAADWWAEFLSGPSVLKQLGVNGNSKVLSFCDDVLKIQLDRLTKKEWVERHGLDKASAQVSASVGRQIQIEFSDWVKP